MLDAQIHIAGLCSSADSMLVPRSARQHAQRVKAISRRQLPESCVFSVDWAGGVGIGPLAGAPPPPPLPLPFPKYAKLLLRRDGVRAATLQFREGKREGRGR